MMTHWGHTRLEAVTQLDSAGSRPYEKKSLFIEGTPKYSSHIYS